MDYSFWLATKGLLYARFHRQNSTYHSLCYTSHGALAGMRNSSIGPPWGINLMTHHTMSECSTTELHLILTRSWLSPYITVTCMACGSSAILHDYWLFGQLHFLISFHQKTIQACLSWTHPQSSISDWWQGLGAIRLSSVV